MIIDDYRKYKQLVPGGLLAVRIGDFFEAFDEDAAALSEIVEAATGNRRHSALCTRNGAQMWGFPYHAVSSYQRMASAAGSQLNILDDVAAALKEVQ